MGWEREKTLLSARAKLLPSCSYEGAARCTPFPPQERCVAEGESGLGAAALIRLPGIPSTVFLPPPLGRPDRINKHKAFVPFSTSKSFPPSLGESRNRNIEERKRGRLLLNSRRRPGVKKGCVCGRVKNGVHMSLLLRCRTFSPSFFALFLQYILHNIVPLFLPPLPPQDFRP